MATDVNEVRLEGLVHTDPNFREGENVNSIDFVLKTEIRYGDRDPTTATHLIRGWEKLADDLDAAELKPGDRLSLTGRLAGSKDGDVWYTRVVLDQHCGEFEVVSRGDGQSKGRSERRGRRDDDRDRGNRGDRNGGRQDRGGDREDRGGDRGQRSAAGRGGDGRGGERSGGERSSGRNGSRSGGRSNGSGGSASRGGYSNGNGGDRGRREERPRD